MISRFSHHFPSRRSHRPNDRGFTIIELMIVITIIMILMAMAAGRYQQSIIRAKETALHQDLFVLRQAIQQYTLDKNQAPQSLDELVDAKYMREVPTDPITHEKDWDTETSDLLLSPDQTTTGISDVHSRSSATSPFENTPYNSW
jgi:general secretion pathway protein G